MKLTIDRKTWLRGEGCSASFLLRQDGKKCCLGFYALKKGFNLKYIKDKKSLAQLPNPMKNFPDFCREDEKRNDYFNSNFAGELMSNNDSKYLTCSERENKIAKLFKEIKVDVEFIN